MSEVLFVWDADSSSSKRRSFYRRLSGYKNGDYVYEGLLDDLPDEDWDWLNESTLLVKPEQADRIRGLLREFNDILRWHEFEATRTV